MDLGGKLLNSLRIETQILERLQSLSVVDGAAAHTQKDDAESNGGSLENVAEVFVLLLCGVQLVLRYVAFTIVDLDEVDVTPSYAVVFRSVLSGVGGSTGGWRCWGWWLYWWLAVLLRSSQSPSIAPCHSEEPTPLQLFVDFVFLQWWE